MTFSAPHRLSWFRTSSSSVLRRHFSLALGGSGRRSVLPLLAISTPTPTEDADPATLPLVLRAQIFDHCKKADEHAIFDLVLKQMKGKWADCATVTENGTISVQQVFESWPGMRYMVRVSSIFGRLLLWCEDDRLKSRWLSFDSGTGPSRGHPEHRPDRQRWVGTVSCYTLFSPCRVSLNIFFSLSQLPHLQAPLEPDWQPPTDDPDGPARVALARRSRAPRHLLPPNGPPRAWQAGRRGVR